MQTNFLILLNIVILIIGIIVIIRYNKIRREKFLELLIEKINLENMNVIDCFSKDALAVYLSVLGETNQWTLTEHTLSKNGTDLHIWAANTVDSRRFYNNQLTEEAKKELEEKNLKLTYYDKVLFDKIIQSYKNRQTQLVTKFFL